MELFIIGGSVAVVIVGLMITSLIFQIKMHKVLKREHDLVAIRAFSQQHSNDISTNTGDPRRDRLRKLRKKRIQEEIDAKL